MKALRLDNYLTQFIQHIMMIEQEGDEVGLGFDTMLSHDVVKFLITDHSIIKPSVRRVIFTQDADFAMDEHELAMI